MVRIILTALALAGCALAAAGGFVLGLKLPMPWENMTIRTNDWYTCRRCRHYATKAD